MYVDIVRSSCMIGTFLILSFLVGMFVFAAVTTKEVTWLLAAILLFIFAVLVILQQIQENRRKKGKTIKRFVPWNTILVFYVLGIMCIILTTLLVMDIDNRIHSKSIVATVIDVQHNHDEDEDSAETCNAYAKYVVNHKKYVSKYETSSFACGKKIGDMVKIYYRTDNPEKVTTNKNLFFLLLGTVMVYGCLVLYIRKVRKNKNQN